MENGLTLEDLSAGQKPLEVDWKKSDGTTVKVNVSYDPNEWTLETVHKMGNLLRRDQGPQYVEVFTRVVKSWDLRRTKDGPIVEINGENLYALPFYFIDSILTKIGDDVVPN